MCVSNTVTVDIRGAIHSRCRHPVILFFVFERGACAACLPRVHMRNEKYVPPALRRVRSIVGQGHCVYLNAEYRIVK